MFKQIIDISVAIENNQFSDPATHLPKIQYIDHKESFAEMAPFFSGLKQEDLPDGEAWANEKIELITHNGTHLDAPYHYATTMDKGKPALTIDEVPLEWCIASAVKLDLTHLADGYVATQDDIQKALHKIEHTLSPFEIVLVHTRAAFTYGTKEYLLSGCGIGREATLFLLDQGVKITGTDAWSWDAPFSHTAKRYQETKDATLIWEGHKAGREGIFCHLEKLSNLDKLPSSGFMVACFPVKIKKASAAWTRAVALIPK